VNRFRELLAGWTAPLRERAGGAAAAEGSAAPAPPEELVIERVLRSVANNSLLLADRGVVDREVLLRRLASRLEALDDPVWCFLTIPVDLRGVEEEDFFDLLTDAVFAALGPHLDGLQAEDCSRPPGDLGFRRLATNLRLVLKRLATRTPRRVKLVLLINGIDRLNHFRPRVNQKLRSLFMKSFAEHLVAVVSGVGVRRAWEREGSPWFNFFEEIEVRLAAG